MNRQLENLPLVVTREVAILPGVISHFDLDREKNIRAVEMALLQNNRVFLLAQRDPEAKEIPEDPDELYEAGTIVNIRQIIKLQDGIVRVLAECEDRAWISQIYNVDKFLRADVWIDEGDADDMPDAHTQEAMARVLLEALMEYGAMNPKVGKALMRQVDGGSSLVDLVRVTSETLPLDFAHKQKLLESETLKGDYEILLEYLMTETDVIRIKAEIQQKLQEKVDKNQKDYILREQMKVIREELGDDSESEAETFRKQLEKLQANKDVKEWIEKEIKRFESTAGNVSEATVSRNYIETLLALPWNKATRDNKDLGNAKRILDEDHYGLDDVKERVLEYLAVRSLTKKGDAPIICLVGPPGTGKTSIARSVARALGKKYIRIGLGGVRDEAEIRGHRRTYIGAMPGRIAKALRQTGVNNPLILLDEVDKTGRDYKGDVASALLELLDSEQNSRFSDHYVEIPLDLSNALFIATANDMSTIPQPLLDRMEVIEVSSYTENEKMHIAKEHLIEKQKKANGIRPDQLSISDGALHHIISGYTREAGVRNLERKIGSICRKAAREIYEDKKKKVTVTESNLKKYLGKERFTEENTVREDEVGTVCGLAWTSVGGTTLQVEVNVTPGKGGLVLTGKLGDVMKESAQAGITYVESISEEYGISQDFFTTHDIHIHIPEGAVPKDGPSAGITMASAVLSAITGRKIRGDVAMTGEITLRGRVLPIGGLKEKLLAARMAGIKTVCVPEKNRADVAEISNEITKGLNLEYVSTMDQVIETALI